MCTVIDVSRSAFYEWLKKPLTKTEQEDRELAEKIKQLFFDSRCTYGHRRIKKKLRKKGTKCSNDRIRRLMKQVHLVATIKKELIRRKRFKTRSWARLAVIDHILWYNSERIHSYLDDMSPMEFEQQYYNNMRLTAA
ncbi:IS3 family transposase [Candidatus Contubernalis alkaliaceticus]|uniref:IS3 family transposase n=1 Tax=Candidatus Contubernalis alkaliaceticus TaxID=338645 RepID=UPI001F4C2D7A|nr:IS3 family transposase [Candidatus Contubernalis alkalaceticus]UNC91556.1 IS3 family transposase [Candidatus Contubernalis alkalaceticus]